MAVKPCLFYTVPNYHNLFIGKIIQLVNQVGDSGFEEKNSKQDSPNRLYPSLLGDLDSYDVVLY